MCIRDRFVFKYAAKVTLFWKLQAKSDIFFLLHLNFILTVSELLWRYAYVPFKVLTEKGYIREVQGVRYLLDSQVRSHQLRFCVHDYHIGYDIGYGTSGLLLDDHAEVLGRNT